MKIAAIWLCGTLWLFAGEYYYMNGDKRVDLQEIPAGVTKHSLSESLLYFRNANGKKVGIPNRIIVKFRSMENFDRYLQAYGLKIVKKFNFGNMFLLEAETPKKALEAANSLYGEPDVILAQPDLIREWRLR